MKVLLAGDVHGDTEFVASCCRRAAELGEGTILQLGDFGAL